MHKGKGRARKRRVAKCRKSDVILVLIQDIATNLTDTEDPVGDASVTCVTCVSVCVSVRTHALVSVCITFLCCSLNPW